ncbi:hypothetical protein ACT3UA_12080 [Glutamicibacter sp. 363]|uniref:hypothetical protein n=1 Tax=unclassified Glutamicibacter TaxID=2627139 RepID=UPI004034017B
MAIRAKPKAISAIRPSGMAHQFGAEAACRLPGVAPAAERVAAKGAADHDENQTRSHIFESAKKLLLFE